MADKMFITLEVDDKGTAVVKRFDSNTQAAFDKMKKNASAGSEQAGKMRKAWTGAIDTIRDKWKVYSAVAGVAIAAVGTAAVAGAKKILASASDLQEMQGKFDVVFAGQKEKAESWALTLVNSYAMSTREAKQYLSSVQDLLVPMGMAADKAGEMSNEVVKLSADLGSFNNVSTAKVMDDIQSALVGNYETMKKYGVVLNATTVEEKALAMGLAETKDGLTAGMKAQAAYALMVEGSTAAIGDMARTSESAANQEKQTKALLEDISALLGKTLIPYYQEILKAINEWLQANKAMIEQNLPGYIVKVGDAIVFAVNVMRFFHNGWLGLQLVAQAAIVGIVFGLEGLFKALRFILLPLDMIFNGLKAMGMIAVNPFDRLQKGLDDFKASSIDATKQVLADIETTNQAYDSVIAKVEGWKNKIAEVPVEQAKTSSAVISSVKNTASVIEAQKPEFKIDPVANEQLEDVRQKAVGTANAIENMKPVFSVQTAILGGRTDVSGDTGTRVTTTSQQSPADLRRQIAEVEFGLPPSPGLMTRIQGEQLAVWREQLARAEAVEARIVEMTPTFQTGTGPEGLPYTGLFHGHKGEIVKNPEESDKERRGGGGDTYIITLAPRYMTGDSMAARKAAEDIERELIALRKRRG